MSTVSVIIPYYNRKETIIRALDSVKNQTYKDFEIIAIDDGSNDETAEIVEQYILENNNLKFKHIHQKNGGPSKARNRGIIEADGKYLAFLDSDDTWKEDKLKIQIEFMENNEDIVISSTNYEIIINNKSVIKEKHNKDFVESNFYKMLFKSFFCMPTVVMRKDIIIKDHLFFLENKNYAEDHLLFLQICRKYRGAKITKPLGCIYKLEYGKGGLSENLNELTKNELYNFLKLYKENKNKVKKINLILFICIYFIGIIKHFKRIVKAKLIY